MSIKKDNKSVLNFLTVLAEVSKRCRNMTKEEQNQLEEYKKRPEVMKKYGIKRTKLDF